MCPLSFSPPYSLSSPLPLLAMSYARHSSLLFQILPMQHSLSEHFVWLAAREGSSSESYISLNRRVLRAPLSLCHSYRLGLSVAHQVGTRSSVLMPEAKTLLFTSPTYLIARQQYELWECWALGRDFCESKVLCKQIIQMYFSLLHPPNPTFKEFCDVCLIKFLKRSPPF